MKWWSFSDWRSDLLLELAYLGRHGACVQLVVVCRMTCRVASGGPSMGGFPEAEEERSEDAQLLLEQGIQPTGCAAVRRGAL